MEELMSYSAGIFFHGLAVLFLVAGLLTIIDKIFKKRKSQEYRKLVTDMYVAAKARLLAKEDSLDLDKEEETFKAWLKKTKLKDNIYDLDSTIEEELKEKVSEPKKTKK